MSTVTFLKKFKWHLKHGKESFVQGEEDCCDRNEGHCHEIFKLRRNIGLNYEYSVDK